jgi:hypothetical protein
MNPIIYDKDIYDDFALLPFQNGVLYNNVFAKGGIKNSSQHIFKYDTTVGWEWEWPENEGLFIKTYPEIVLGKSPWSKAQYGNQIPCRLNKIKQNIEFDITTNAEGSWCLSFDFWITKSINPEPIDITCNLCIWTKKNSIEGSYNGKHEVIRIGERAYDVITETPHDQPNKHWNTLFAVDQMSRSEGILELQPFIELLINRGLAKEDDYLATAELGNEIAYGKGKTTVDKFMLI